MPNYTSQTSSKFNSGNLGYATEGFNKSEFSSPQKSNLNSIKSNGQNNNQYVAIQSLNELFGTNKNSEFIKNSEYIKEIQPYYGIMSNQTYDFESYKKKEQP